MKKRILITGGSGFIGHHIIEHLLKNTDWDIVTLDRLSLSGNWNRLTSLEVWPEHGHRVYPLVHDLRYEINPWVAAEIGQVDYIFHLSASTHVDRSIADPMSFVLDNVVATTNLLEFAKEQKSLESFLYFSTDEVFGPAPEGVAYKEWDRYCSGNPYAAAKAGGEEMAVAYANTYGMPILITHTMNVFGERQHPEKFIPLVIKKVLADEVVTIHANKERNKAGSRFWIHGRNVAAALLFILENAKLSSEHPHPHCDKFNIVGEKEVDNLEMAQTIARILGKELKYEMVDFHSSRPGHDLRYALDGTKLKEMGWDLPVDFEHSLARTIEWTIKNDKWLHQ